MNSEEAKAFVRRHFEEFVNRRDLSAADRNFAADYLEHGPDAGSTMPPGPQGPKQYLSAAFNRYSEFHVTIEDMIAEGDKVVVRNRWRATERASGQKFEFSGIVIWRIADGKLAERWSQLQLPKAVAETTARS